MTKKKKKRKKKTNDFNTSCSLCENKKQDLPDDPVQFYCINDSIHLNDTRSILILFVFSSEASDPVVVFCLTETCQRYSWNHT